jgi:transcriptional regulator with PAS, ATPase and Fis domain
VLQNKTFEPLGGTEPVETNARILTATNQDLSSMVAEGTFRQDLFYRINVLQVELPPLRERPEDILPLVRHFVNRLAMLHEKRVEGVTPDALRILLAHQYPGNVRELENIVEHGFVLSTGPLIGVEHLPRWLGEGEKEAPCEETLEDCERRVIRLALARNQGNRASAAEELGIHKSTLYRKMRRLGLIRPPEPGRPTPG